MSLRVINLGEEEVLKLNDLFGVMPYGVTRDRDAGYIAYVWTGERDEAFMNYCSKGLFVYHSIIKTFPENIQKDIISKLKEVASLENIINEGTFLN